MQDYYDGAEDGFEDMICTVIRDAWHYAWVGEHWVEGQIRDFLTTIMHHGHGDRPVDLGDKGVWSSVADAFKHFVGH